MKILKPFFSLAASFSVTILFAQTDFSGTYNFTTQQSISGKLYSNGNPKSVTIEQDTTSMIITTITAAGNGTNVTETNKFSFDGKPIEVIGAKSKRKRISTFTWSADKISFTITLKIYSATDPTHVDYGQTDIWKMQDGDLVLDRSAENGNNGETWEAKAMFEKQ